ncbi:MAG: hypothetical protein PUP90_25530 [Nostoc sp. S4]|nr:hypothetical protein [Nostoc sp. S4]
MRRITIFSQSILAISNSHLNEYWVGALQKLLHPTIHEQAAAYLYYLAMNHPFIDILMPTNALHLRLWILS